jgi:hypothetical protein
VATLVHLREAARLIPPLAERLPSHLYSGPANHTTNHAIQLATGHSTGNASVQ